MWHWFSKIRSNLNNLFLKEYVCRRVEYKSTFVKCIAGCRQTQKQRPDPVLLLVPGTIHCFLQMLRSTPSWFFQIQNKCRQTWDWQALLTLSWAVGRLVSDLKTGYVVLPVLILYFSFFFFFYFYFYFFASAFLFGYQSGIGSTQINLGGQLHIEAPSGVDPGRVCVSRYFPELPFTLKISVLMFSNDFRFEIHVKKTKFLGFHCCLIVF